MKADLPGHSYVESERFRLYAYKTDFERLFARHFSGQEKIRKPDVVDRKLGVERGPYGIPCQCGYEARILSEIDRVDDQYPVPVLKDRQEIQSHGPAIDDIDRGRETETPAEFSCNMNPGAFVGKQDIAEPQHSHAFPLLPAGAD